MRRGLIAASFVLAPAAVAARFLGAPDVALFAVGAAALVPLAWAISRATEETAKHTGPALGGLLNASFGNATELMVALFAIADGLHEVVRGSVTGSILGNLLLVLGLSLLVAGRGELDRRPTLVSLLLLAASVPAIVVLALPHLLGRDDTSAYAPVTVPVAAALLAAYAAAVVYDVRREAREQDSEQEAGWSLGRSLGLLALAMAGAAAMSELITATIESFAELLHVSVFFVAAVVVAAAGNAAEHGTAVIVAARGELQLAADVALESAAQVAALVLPALLLVSFAVEPLPAAFRPVELVALAGGTVVALALLAQARSSRWRGAVLVGAYAGVVAAFLLG